MKKIKGAGLSGLASAISFALKGEKTIVMDRSSQIGSKFPESVHAFRNYSSQLDEYELIKYRKFLIRHLRPIHKIIKLGPSLIPSIMYAKDRPLFYAVKRGNSEESIDKQLFDQAESLGVTFNFKVNSDKDVDIIATGPAFSTEIGYGHHYKGVDVDPDTIIFLLNDDYAPKGYAYAIPYGNDSVSVVTTTFDLKSFSKMPMLFSKLIKEVSAFSDLIDGGKKGPVFAKIGFSLMPRTAKIKNKLLVGEAAGFSEADRGFGMHYALESGFLAAKSLMEGLDYDKLWKESFEKELLKAFKRRLILNRIGNNEYDKLINSGTEMSAKDYVKHKEEQNKNLIKDELDNIRLEYEIDKLQKKFDIGRLYEKVS